MFSAKDTVATPATDDRATTTGTTLRAVLVATAVALVGALGTYAIARAVSGDLVVDGPTGATPVPVGAVVVATVVAGFAAWGLSVLARRTSRPRTVLVGLLALGLLVSTVPPLSGATTTTTAAWLLLIHLVVAVPLVTLAWRLVQRPA